MQIKYSSSSALEWGVLAGSAPPAECPSRVSEGSQ